MEHQLWVQSQKLLTNLSEDSRSRASLSGHTINVIKSITKVPCLSSEITTGRRIPYLPYHFLAVACKSAAHSPSFLTEKPSDQERLAPR